MITAFIGMHLSQQQPHERPVAVADLIVDMIKNCKTASLPSPLNRYWWEVSSREDNLERSCVEARLEFVSQVKKRSVLGLDFGSPVAHLQTVIMRWSVKPLKSMPLVSQVTVEWTNPGSSTNSYFIPQVMCEMTDRLLEALVKQRTAMPQSLVGKPPVQSAQQMIQSTRKSGLAGRFPQAAHTQGGRASKQSWQTAHVEQPARSAEVLRKPAKAAFWPAPQDYQEAIQNPVLVFSDDELRAAEPEMTVLGMPKVATGAFASVYRMFCKERELAVRFFLTPMRDQAYRYHQLSNFILADDLTYTVGFEFQQEGVKVSGQSFPLLKMEWVEGTSLSLYVGDLFEDKEAMEQLLQRFRLMTQELREAGVAHGDLQHGNVMVRDGELYLVDYDGMYVPSLRAEGSNELGHRNYQHPSRAARHFGAYLDNFSAWVIDTSLFALTVDPQLWRATEAGDEALLFKRNDFVNVADSRVFHLLEKHSCKELKMRAEFLRQMLDDPLEELPYLNADGTPFFAPPEVTPPVEPAQATMSSDVSPLPDWMQ